MPEVVIRNNNVVVQVSQPGTTESVILARGPAGGKGDKGDPRNAGPANSLSVGTVTTGAAGSPASATVTGAAPTQTLNLTLPRGDQGPKGDPGTNGLGVPPGGAINTILTKASAADNDTVWAAAPPSTPSGAAGGDLAGTYPNPTIKTALNDPVAATPGLRTLGTGAQQAAAGNHGHTPAAIGAVAKAGDVMTGTLEAPAIAMTPSAGTAKGRFGGLSGVDAWTGMFLNCAYVAGSGWVLDDTAKPGWFFKLDSRAASTEFAVYRIPAGAGYHTDEAVMFKVDSTGLVSVANRITGVSNATGTSDALPKGQADGLYATITNLNLKAPLASPTFTGTVSGITKSMVGLGSVDNTADTAKPVSTAQQTALDAKATKALGGSELVAAGSATTGTVTLNCANASIFTISPTGNITLAPSNVPASGTGCTITVIINQGATPYTLTMPGGSVWLGSAPTQTASKKCVVTMLTTDGGTTWLSSGVVQA